ncbi:hypothetical protein EBN88_24000 [Streptomyces triticirhizae]|uniref:Uncharacterized protein n=1 Tax=Streptomyces triticirhizae TaxID=2483353 RepID=A0A3M2L8F7_9ACTN|nr:hypothetical protein EBN88_24000 [Streptomyces triticirhizae]
MLEHPRKQLKNLALTFGTLLSSQGTDASIKPPSGPSGRFPSLSAHAGTVPSSELLRVPRAAVT